MFVSERASAGRTWDLSAATLSSVCVLHCLGLPLLTTLLPVASLFSDSHLLHVAMVLLAIPVTLRVVLSEVATRRREVFITAALTGLCLMLAAVLVPVPEAYETPLTVIGGALLVCAHLWRWFQHQARFPSVSDDA